jgi:chromosomal replication initiation ATPase DnaA
MRDNLEAKLYDVILKATKEEIPEIESIKLIVDSNIDSPSNTDAIDCAKFLKENAKTKKKDTTSDNNKTTQNKTTSDNTNINNRYTLENFIV